jgi:hypothetical protein
MKNFDMVNGFVVDYMHTALLGVLKTLTNKFLNSSNHLEQFYLNKDKALEIDTRLLAVRIPYECNRQTRGVKDIAHWKANEWKTWMMVCIPILDGILPAKYLNNLSKFVLSMSLLLTDNVTKENIALSKTLYKEFAQKAAKLYGKEICSFNMHILHHSGDCVLNWGPLWSYSLFPFENANGMLTKLITGTRQVCMQIIKKVNILRELNTFGGQHTNEAAGDFFWSMIDDRKLYRKVLKVNKNVTMVGPRRDYTLTNDESSLLIQGKVDIASITKVWSYKTFFANGAKFCVDSADSRRYCNSIASKGDEQYVIKKVLLISIGMDRPKCALMFANKILVKQLKNNQFVLKVEQITNATHVFNCASITLQKYVSVWNTEGQLTHLSKILNTAESE